MGSAQSIERMIDLAKEDLKEGPEKSVFGAWLMINTAHDCLRDPRIGGQINLFDQVKYLRELTDLANKIKPTPKA